MLQEVAHVGITVSDMERSISFYRDVLGLCLSGTATMKGKETDRLFNRNNCVAKLAYLNGSKQLLAPPVELIQFDGEGGEGCEIQTPDLHKTSISEICFRVDDIDVVYKTLKEKQVEFLSEPQTFDFSMDGLGKSKAVYFKDPDGIILELMQYIE